jgi:hypothetical protein
MGQRESAQDEAGLKAKKPIDPVDEQVVFEGSKPGKRIRDEE